MAYNTSKNIPKSVQTALASKVDLASSGVAVVSGGEFGEGSLVLAGYAGYYSVAGGDDAVSIGPTNSSGVPTGSSYAKFTFGGLQVGGVESPFEAIQGTILFYDPPIEEMATLTCSDGYYTFGRQVGAGRLTLGRSYNYSYDLDSQSITANRYVALPDRNGTLMLASEEKSSNFTAEIHGVYITTASLTVTDPTASQGKGYEIIVRNGTTTINGVGYSTAGTRIHRIYHSGAWATYHYLPS